MKQNEICERINKCIVTSPDCKVCKGENKIKNDDNFRMRVTNESARFLVKNISLIRILMEMLQDMNSK